MASASGIKRKGLPVIDKLNILKKFDESYAAKKKQIEIAKEQGIPPMYILLRTLNFFIPIDL